MKSKLLNNVNNNCKSLLWRLVNPAPPLDPDRLRYELKIVNRATRTEKVLHFDTLEDYRKTMGDDIRFDIDFEYYLVKIEGDVRNIIHVNKFILN